MRKENILKIKKKGYFFIGCLMLIFLISSYFVNVPIEDGANYNTIDTLLGIIIFHNPFILALYVLIGVVLIVKGFGK